MNVPHLDERPAPRTPEGVRSDGGRASNADAIFSEALDWAVTIGGIVLVAIASALHR